MIDESGDEGGWPIPTPAPSRPLNALDRFWAWCLRLALALAVVLAFVLVGAVAAATMFLLLSATARANTPADVIEIRALDDGRVLLCCKQQLGLALPPPRAFVVCDRYVVPLPPAPAGQVYRDGFEEPPPCSS